MKRYLILEYTPQEHHNKVPLQAYRGIGRPDYPDVPSDDNRFVLYTNAMDLYFKNLVYSDKDEAYPALFFLQSDIALKIAKTFSECNEKGLLFEVILLEDEKEAHREGICWLGYEVYGLYEGGSFISDILLIKEPDIEFNHFRLNLNSNLLFSSLDEALRFSTAVEQKYGYLFTSRVISISALEII